MESTEATESFPRTSILLDRVRIEEKGRYIKRELREPEFFRRRNGNVVHPYWTRERIQNEADAIKFIAANTHIPVPECRLYEKDGLIHLETKTILGVTLWNIDEENKSAAVKAVTRQMEQNILPQLRKLRRDFIGCVDPSLPVIPPTRIYHRDRRVWERITSPGNPAFVFCHNDLSPHNILIDPNTFQITGILDWEFAGYFPPEWELPIWRCLTLDEPRQMGAEVWARDLALFGLKPDDIKDCAEAT